MRDRARAGSGVHRAVGDALSLAGRVTCEAHGASPARGCLGCQCARGWRCHYERAGVPVDRYARDPFNDGAP